MIEKFVVLGNTVKDKKGVVAQMRTVLKGDGATPDIMTIGGEKTIGYNDDGSPIAEQIDSDFLEKEQQKMMAEAIKEQKKLCVENGVDPDLVNILHAEKKVNTNE